MAVKWTILGVAILIFIILLFTSYVKAPPDVAYIISGMRKQPKVLIGRAGIKIPFFERLDKLVVRQISIDIKTGDYVPTLDFIGVNIDAVAKVRVMTDEEGIQKAMKNFLNLKEEEIMNALVDSLQGNMREIIGTVNLKDLCNDRKVFGDQVQEKAQKDMNNLGIEIISCNIQHVTDQNDLIPALGQDNMAAIQKNASIAKANADRDVAIAQAAAKKEANDASVKAETEIAIKQNELSIKKAELKTVEDTKKAEADAAYKIQAEEQRRSIGVSAANADIARQEREVELKAREAEVQEQSLNAQIRKQADAKKYEQQQMADVELYKRQKDAEAKKYEAEQQAEARKLEADALKYAMEQEAAGIAAKGRAEAEAIQAKAEAEAAGIDKKAEAMQKYGEAAIIEMLCKMYPQVAEAIATPLSNIDKITMYGSGNAAKLTEDVTTSLKQIIDGVGDSLGINPSTMLSSFAGTKLANMAPAAQKESPIATVEKIETPNEITTE
ncbi:MAG: SPFH domain-containing protein [Eubacteriales bacterium]|nr:SPFH domain-containing protein [Lachnospiraceae bacterium]MDO5126321.1 SPFH domain-containing protein [Eubacteriales bacterium]